MIINDTFRLFVRLKILIFLFLLVLVLSCGKDTNSGIKKTIAAGEIKETKNGFVKIKRIVDGDTFELETGEKVRPIGIDCPEKSDSQKLDKDSKNYHKDKKIIKELGKKAKNYTVNLLTNQYVKLVSDSTNSDKDRYGRLLRYVYLENSDFFNLKIILDGYAYAYLKYPFIYMKEFGQAQNEARENKRGLWGDMDFDDMK